MKYAFVFLLFLPIFCFSQETEKDEIYLDENLKPIDFTEFYSKNLSFLFFKTKTKKDSVTINMLHRNYKLGTFNEEELSQIKLFLKSNYKNQNPNNKNIILSFRDILYSYQSLKDTRDSLHLAHNHKEKDDFTSYRYNDLRNDFDRQQKKCNKNYSKYNIETYYFYRKKLNFNFNYKNVSWHKIPRFFETLFFSRQHSSVVIIKPNGQYFYYHRMPEKFIKQILKKDISQIINTYESSLSNLSREPFGFFKDVANYRSNRNLSYRIVDDNKRYQSGNGSLSTTVFRDREAFLTNQQEGFKCYSYGSY
jgi:hypothetical protein